ncbi:probable LRR receptor-like serine/threonine-protein kinase RKF3 [Humulus lupulus]|uniref:probable LRR receptor-like serine/threonine-protein kinase RKF3 n=1 Tax=Humulus lupulus TaxID=3486 RepID=UPI002B4101A5|nr:probable LRR receptor-like serine/threonine-protein kinase RKF3 [Humulus lupulus]
MPFLFFFLLLGLTFNTNLSFTIATTTADHEYQNDSFKAFCPLNMEAIHKIIVQSSQRLMFIDISSECSFMLQGLRLLRAVYLRATGNFFPPPNAAEACWDAYNSLVDEFIPGFKIQSTCRFGTSLMSQQCLNITTRSHFETLVSKSELKQIWDSCHQSLHDSSICGSCVEILSKVLVTYFNGSGHGNATDCIGYPFIYSAAFVNRYGPTNLDTVKCLFSLDFGPEMGKSNRKSKKRVFRTVFGGCLTGFFGAIVVFWILWRRHRKRKRNTNMAKAEMGFAPNTEPSSRNTTIIKLSFEEVKRTTKNFSRENIIGRGSYGNVFKGILEDGSEVALKRFKNCSAAEDETFLHEVEVIGSIRHVNLVALRGYCTETMPLEGHQRIIVCELVKNGSLYDHLFDTKMTKLRWPTRRKIALGVARGIGYLHNGVKPSIIHRDIKASNIVIDENFEAKLTDFGLAKFTPEGFSHLSTKVAGTFGYVAPEYALYGQLSERSDVYSFGVVLLQLLSGKRAVIEEAEDNNGALLLTEWAWSLVKQGRALDVVEDGMTELGPVDEMEKYVLVAVISCHPLSQARPPMDRVVKMLEEDFPAEASHDQPLLAELACGFADTMQLMSYGGWSPDDDIPSSFVSKSDHPMLELDQGRRSMHL